jgi:hypothetical protein
MRRGDKGRGEDLGGAVLIRDCEEAIKGFNEKNILLWTKS